MPLETKDAIMSTGIELVKVTIKDLNTVKNPEKQEYKYGDKTIETVFDLEITYEDADGDTFKTENKKQLRVKSWAKQFKLEEYEEQLQVKYNGYRSDLVVIARLYEAAGNEIPKKDFNLNDFIGFEFGARVVKGEGKKGPYHFIDWTQTLIGNDIELPDADNPDVYDGDNIRATKEKFADDGEETGKDLPF